jgi:tRNA-Thr(GGU) m(6)t(6)A37 methyltransferase TsaA
MRDADQKNRDERTEHHVQVVRRDAEAPCSLSWRVVPIGVVHTPYGSRIEVPKHFERVGRGTVELFAEYEAGLRDIGGFSHIWLITLLHHATDFELEIVPRGRSSLHGLFTTRSPRRPNPVGLTLVELLSVEGRFLKVLGADLWDGTPLLDVKPYLTRCDVAAEARCGWCDSETCR